MIANLGLNSVSNLTMLQEKGLGFIVAQKVTNLGRKATEDILSEDGMTVTESGSKTKLVSDFEKTGPKGTSIKCDMLVSWNPEREARDLAVLAHDRELPEKAVEKNEEIKKVSRVWQALVVTEGKTPKAKSVNETAYEKRKKLCGHSAVVWRSPPDPPGSITRESTAGVYHRQVRIEECFRIMKSDLSLRPMYARTAEHIRGHFLCCVLALVILRLIERRSKENGDKLSPGRICAALQDAQCAAAKGPGRAGVCRGL